MADDNQNAEMEDILSSIKNILEEDEQNKSAAIKNPEDEPDVESGFTATIEGWTVVDGGDLPAEEVNPFEY